MNRDDKIILDQLRLLELRYPEEKRDNLNLLIQVYMEVLNRCPYLSEAPLEEQKELIRILKEYHLI